MVTAVKVACPVSGCGKVVKGQRGLSVHTVRAHSSTSPDSLDTRKDGQVHINLEKFPDGQLPTQAIGGFTRSILLTPTTWGGIAVFGLLISQAISTDIASAIGLLIAAPVVVLAMWWFSESTKYTQIGVICDPPDPDGRIRIEFQWWEKKIAKLLPQEARRTNRRSVYYVIDAIADPPIAFTPFTVEPPEYAVPVRGAMVNQQVANEQLNKVHYKGMRPEVIEKAFALIVIGALILANIAIHGQGVEFVAK